MAASPPNATAHECVVRPLAAHPRRRGLRACRTLHGPVIVSPSDDDADDEYDGNAAADADSDARGYGWVGDHHRR